MTTTARKPNITSKRSFLDRWLNDPEAYPEEFKSWLINFVQQSPNLLLDPTQLPNHAGSKLFDASIEGTKLVDDSVEGRKLKWHVGASPPGSPSDQDIWIYDGSSFYWKFIYESAQATYKWMFLGGGTLLTQSTGAISGTTSGSWTFYASGLSLTLPRDGDYDVEWSCRGQASGASGNTALGAGPSINSTTTPFMEATAQSAASSGWANCGGCARITGASAGDVVRMLTFQNSGAACPFDNRALRIRPVRVI